MGKEKKNQFCNRKYTTPNKNVKKFELGLKEK